MTPNSTKVGHFAISLMSHWWTARHCEESARAGLRISHPMFHCSYRPYSITRVPSGLSGCICLDTNKIILINNVRSNELNLGYFISDIKWWCCCLYNHYCRCHRSRSAAVIAVLVVVVMTFSSLLLSETLSLVLSVSYITSYTCACVISIPDRHIMVVGGGTVWSGALPGFDSTTNELLMLQRFLTKSLQFQVSGWDSRYRQILHILYRYVLIRNELHRW